MTRLCFIVPPEWDAKPVKNFVRLYLGFSARALSELKRTSGGMERNGQPIRAVDLLCAGDELILTPPEEEGDYSPVEAALSVLYESGDFLVLEKPAHMPVHPSPGHDLDSLCNAVACYYAKTGQRHLVRPLYRLDRDTSGIVVLAKHRPAAGAEVSKKYYAVCEGELSGLGTIDLPIGLGKESKIRRVCGVGERAVTHWRALHAEQGHTLLELTLETGRTHQIRAHFSHIGHPLAGDDLYGGSRARIGRQALHCGMVRLLCPALQTDETFMLDLPDDIRAAFPWVGGALPPDA